MEDIQGANQSAEPIISEPTHKSAAETPATTQEPPAAPEGIKVKYNKEERVIGYDEAPEWIQKGLNYDKLQERVTQFESHSKQLERAAKYHGFQDVDSYLQAIEEEEQAQRIEEEARRLGVDQSVVIEHLQPLRDKVDQLTQRERDLEVERQQYKIQQELVDMRAKYPDFDQYGSQIVELVRDRGYPLEDAYILASHHDKLARIQQETESNTIRSLQANAAAATGPLGAEGAEEKGGYASLTPAQRKDFRERVKRGEVTSI
ncbi:hypothetical protein [Paenibacillus humicus]|uniref:hypothetical protein n=1 Tax=Paenibacillus humicus TaxID=412861 RepID=UPI003F170E36